MNRKMVTSGHAEVLMREDNDRFPGGLNNQLHDRASFIVIIYTDPE